MMCTFTFSYILRYVKWQIMSKLGGDMGREMGERLQSYKEVYNFVSEKQERLVQNTFR